MARSGALSGSSRTGARRGGHEGASLDPPASQGGLPRRGGSRGRSRRGRPRSARGTRGGRGRSRIAGSEVFGPSSIDKDKLARVQHHVAKIHKGLSRIGFRTRESQGPLHLRLAWPPGEGEPERQVDASRAARGLSLESLCKKLRFLPGEAPIEEGQSLGGDQGYGPARAVGLHDRRVKGRGEGEG